MCVNVLISETGFNRNMLKVAKGAETVKTMTLPSTIKEVKDGAFSRAHLRSVVLNEGLETIGFGAFRESLLKCVTFPASLRKID